jgi:hypothetical protein
MLLLAREARLLRVGTVLTDGTKIDPSKIRAVRCDRAQVLRAKLAAGIASPTAQAETDDMGDGRYGGCRSASLPAEIACVTR